MKITRISLLNFLGLTAFKADKLGKLNRITGDNGTGKSAVLKGITEAFKSSGVDPYIIRTGADKAEIMVELDSRVLIERRITPSANNVKVTVEGQPIDSPQKFLNSLLGLGSNFNPIDFFSPKPPKGMTPERYRRELLLSAMPFTLDRSTIIELSGAPDLNWDAIDFAQHGLLVLAQVQKQIYDKRHEVGLDVERQKKSIEQDKLDLPPTANAAQFKAFNLQAITNELAVRRAQIEAHRGDEEKLNQMRIRKDRMLAEISETENLIERKKKELVELQTSLSTKRADLTGLQAEGETFFKKIESFVEPDTAILVKQIADYEAHQRLAMRLEDIDRRQKMLEESASEYDYLDHLHQKLTTDVPRDLLARIDMPISGIEIEDDKILVNGIDIDKVNTAEQIKIAIKIAQALSGKLKVICLDGFQDLDGKTKAAWLKEAEKDDFEYFYTVVEQDPSADGSLKLESETPPDAPEKEKQPSGKGTRKGF